MLLVRVLTVLSFFFFFNDTATTEIYTLSLHDALPISSRASRAESAAWVVPPFEVTRSRSTSGASSDADRKSTRLNSSHGYISYAVFCLKKKKNNQQGGAVSMEQHSVR